MESRQRQQFIHLGVERSTNITHQTIMIASPLLAFQYVTVDVGDHSVGARYEHMGIDRELGL